MDWLFIAALTTGIVMAVPVLLRAIDGVPERATSDDREGDEAASRAEGGNWSTYAFVGFALLAAGAFGLLLVAFDDVPTGVGLVAPAALGLAAGAVHQDILGAIRRRHDVPAETSA